MSLSRVTTWSSGQVLTASALNGEFNSILNNALSLISPLTGALNVNGNDLTSIDEMTLSDASANPSTSGGIRRNGDALVWLLTGSHTNSVKNIAHLIANTSGTPAAGIGTGILFSSESTDEDPCNVGALQFAASDVGTGTEDTYSDILLRVAGAALAAAYRFQATGAYKAIFTHALATADRTYTLPDASTNIVGHDTTDTLTSKTLTAPTITAWTTGTPAADSFYAQNLCRAWLNCGITGTINDSMNVTSINDTGTGLLDITWDRDFASANNVVVASAIASGGVFYCTTRSLAAGTVRVVCSNSAGSVADPTEGYSVAAFGDQT